MGPGYFVIAILGCADGAAQCTPVATLPQHYASASECSAQTQAALVENSGFDFPTMMAECRAGAPRAAAQDRQPVRRPVAARRS